MRFEALTIRNFRAIDHLHLGDLRELVVVAGPNGCGKSAIFHAIRLLKSSYGGYDANEWSNWFNEFQLKLAQDTMELEPLFRDKSEPIVIKAQVSLHASEQQYIKQHIVELLRPLAWRQATKRSPDYPVPQSLATELRQYRNNVEKAIEAGRAAVMDQLGAPSFTIGLEIDLSAGPRPIESHLAELLFQTYAPPNIGIIDYHGDQRHYERERVGGINLSLDSEQNRSRQSALYNFAQKYRNVKSDLVAEYVRSLLAREAGVVLADSGDDLRDALVELFDTFFPGKTFDGVLPREDGSVAFPVRLSTGHIHDINDLSSGEKEVLYEYLRLRRTAPRHSIVLIDEPELHLNPALLQGLPDFYYQHVAQGLSNQLWLVTHSDTLLRQAVGHNNYSVYHMQLAAASQGRNQAQPVQAHTALEQAVIDLVGDLATYVPDAKVVLLEGGGDSEFDVNMVSRLFPLARMTVNFVAGGHRRRVSDLWDVLDRAVQEGALRGRVFAIVDRDNDADGRGESNMLSWDVYHIENYLLEPRFVREACEALANEVVFSDVEAVEEALRESARLTVDQIIGHRLRVDVDRSLVSSIDLSTDPQRSDLAVALREAMDRSLTRVSRVASHELSEDDLLIREHRYRSQLEASLNSDSWRREFRGRDVLKRFAGVHLPGIPYEAFRNVILDKMVAAEHQPAGMKSVIESVLQA